MSNLLKSISIALIISCSSGPRDNLPVDARIDYVIYSGAGMKPRNVEAAIRLTENQITIRMDTGVILTYSTVFDFCGASICAWTDATHRYIYNSKESSITVYEVVNNSAPVQVLFIALR